MTRLLPLLLTALLLAGLLLRVPAGLAEEAPPPAAVPADAEGNQAAPPGSEVDAGDGRAADPANDATGATPSPEVFVPSEEISEDLAVSYPVDI